MSQYKKRRSPFERCQICGEAISVAPSHQLMQPTAIGHRVVGAQHCNAGITLGQQRVGLVEGGGDGHDAAVGQSIEHRFDGVFLADEQLGEIANLAILGAARLEASRQQQLVHELIVEIERRQGLVGERNQPLDKGNSTLDDTPLRTPDIGSRRPIIRRGGRRGGIIFASGFLSDHDVQYI